MQQQRSTVDKSQLPILVDTHCHIDDPGFDKDRDSVIARAAAIGVTTVIVPAITAEGWRQLAEITEVDSSLRPAFGLHPLYCQNHGRDDIDALPTWLSNHDALAIGECGLDGTRDGELQTQRFYFEAQIAIAIEHQLPLIIHDHRAVEAVYDCLKLHNAHAGVIHSFNGSLVQAKRLLDLGFMLGFGGAATFPRARKLRELIAKLPLDALLLETDAPFQPTCNAPTQRNEPYYLKDVFDLFCSLRQESPQKIAETTTQNANRLFSPGKTAYTDNTQS